MKGNVLCETGPASPSVPPLLVQRSAKLHSPLDKCIIQTLGLQFTLHIEKQKMAAPVSVFVRALYDFNATNPSELSFQSGQVIEVLERHSSGWWDGMINNRRGWLPSNYVTPVMWEGTPAPIAHLGNGMDGNETD